MELLQDLNLVRRDWMTTSCDDWTNRLRGICGSFNPQTCNSGQSVLGTASRIDVCGMEFAHVSNDLDYIRRDWEDIRRDAKENLFLILQLEGTCGVEHSGQQSVLDVGECILLDSTKPTTFFFGGRFSNHLSLHLPRQIMYSQSKVDFDIARKLTAGDPMAMILRALVAKIMSTPETDAGTPHLRELVFNATRQAFISEGLRSDNIHSLHDSAAKRLHMVDMLIDRHLTESKLTAKWLATRLGISIRTLQQDFQGMGVTCTTVIRDKRLRYAREKIEQIKEEKGGKTIAEVAYSSGFNDISYFNRSFKELFDCAPTDLLRHQTAQ
ncbi:helix-turn-helix domain-containing protein [Agrobacterium leguminum]|uniref:helix-turn-helix domain-containing protein n=1 Tax=Agrobacterium leguminum TaxID=2792015 RepID=UPI003F733538